MQRATFLNKIVTVSTDFSCKNLKKYLSLGESVFIFVGGWGLGTGESEAINNHELRIIPGCPQIIFSCL
jgi:hypothetical protein